MLCFKGVRYETCNYRPLDVSKIPLRSWLATKWLRILSLGGNDKTRNHLVANPIYVHRICIGLSGKCLSFTDTSFTTTYLYTNMRRCDVYLDRRNLSDVVMFILIEENGSYVYNDKII